MRRILSPASLAALVLAVPVVVALPSTVRKDVAAAREHADVGALEADVVPPFPFVAYRNVPLLLGVRAHVPRSASVAFVSRQPARIYLQTGWIRWVGFAVAPRLVSDARRARWTVYVDRPPPRRARHVWRYRPDSLVRR